MSSAERVLEEEETLVVEMEVEHRRQFGSVQIGSVLFTDRRAVFSYQSNGAWTQFGEADLSAEPFAQYVDGELRAVFIPATDSDAILQLQSDYIEEVESVTGLSSAMSVLGEASRDPPVDPAECTCNRMSSNKVLVENENMELGEDFDEEEFRFVSCEDCFRIYGRYRHGKKASLNKLFSADWLFGGDLSYESIVDFDNEDAYAIHHTPSGPVRVQDALLVLSHIGSRSEEVVSTYKHDYQHALCYVLDDAVVGYLTWEPHERGPILSQLYIREEYRGQGLAADLVSGWYENVCDSEHYFADEPTSGGKAVLSSIGHLDRASGPAREVHNLTPLAFG